MRVLPEVRLVRSDDVEFIARLSDVALRRYDPSVVRNVVRMVRSSATETLVVASGDVRIGFAVIHLRRSPRNFGPWVMPVVAHLDAIAVRPEFEGRGIGARLLAASEGYAQSFGAVSLSLLTAVDNRSAKRLFHAAGYHLVTSVDDAYAGARRGLAMLKGLRRESIGG